MKYCTNCGSELKDGSSFCSKCGAEIGATSVNKGAPYTGNVELKSRTAAGVLQLVFGCFGVGRFYLGYTSIGVAQLLVSIFTCGFGAIWPFIDAILILTGSVTTDADGNPLRD